MRLMPISRVPDGAILGCDLWTSANSSIPLLRAGARMTPRYREALMAAGLRAVHVDDSFSAGIEIKGPVREHIRRQSVETVQRTMAEIRTAVDDGLVFDPHVVEEMTSVASALAAEIELCGEDVGMAFGDLAAADEYTFQHSIDVATLGMVIAHRLFRRHGWVDASGRRRFDRIDQRLVRIGLGLLLHDVGKMTIPSSILNKPGPLDAREWELVKRHPVAGVELLARASLSPLVSVVVRSHHERWDGRGYPDGKERTAIHQFARIASVADVFDAVTSERPYKAAQVPSAGVAVIAEGSNTAFDPECVEIFLQTVAPFPRGSEVLLSDGRRGVVAETPERTLDRPVVRLLPEPGEPDGPPVEVALAEHPELTLEDVSAPAESTAALA